MSVADVYKILDDEIVLNLVGKKPKEVYERLDRMFNHITDSMNKNKWDEAYKMCKRWNMCVEWLKKQKLVDKDIPQKYYSSRKQNHVRRLFKEIKLKIESDFLVRQAKLQNERNPNANNLELQLPDVPTDKPEYNNNCEIICANIVQQKAIKSQVVNVDPQSEIKKLIASNFGFDITTTSNQNTNPSISSERATSDDSSSIEVIGNFRFVFPMSSIKNISKYSERATSGGLMSLSLPNQEKRLRLDTTCELAADSRDITETELTSENTLLDLFVDYVAAQQPGIHTPEEVAECVKMLRRKSSCNLTPFQAAVKQKLNRLLPILIACKGDVNYVDRRGQTILHIFAMHYTDELAFPRANPYKDRDIVETLLRRGASVDGTDKTKNTPVHYAASNRRIDLVQLMLENFVDVDAQNEGGCTVLHELVASYSENPNDFVIEVIRALLSKGADFEAPQNKAGLSALDLATGHCLIGLLKIFDISSVDPEQLLLRICQQAAHWSREYPKELKCLDGLVDLRKVVNTRTEKFLSTPLHYVAKFGRIEAVRMFLDAGADVDAKCVDGVTPLHMAAMKGHLDVVDYLIERGADLRARDQIFDFGLMHLAAFVGDERVINLLVDHGLNVDDESKIGVRPLHLAALGCNGLGVKMLVCHGADVNCCTREERLTPLHLVWPTESTVRSLGDVEVSEFSWVRRLVQSIDLACLYSTLDQRINSAILLVQTGCNANARDARFRTPLHLLTSTLEYPDTTHLLSSLSEHGARVDVVDAENRTPFTNVVNGHSDRPGVLNALLRHGADIDDVAMLPRTFSTAESEELVRYLACLMVIGALNTEACRDFVTTVRRNSPEPWVPSDVLGDHKSETAKLEDEYLVDGETSMYDFLHMDSKRRYHFAESVLALDLKREYPIYHVIIENSCRRAINERAIFNLATSALSQLAGVSIPEVCTGMIFNYMSVKELTTFIDIVEGFAL